MICEHEIVHDLDGRLMCSKCMTYNGIEHPTKLKCSLCNAEFPVDDLIKIRTQRHEEFTHPAAKTNRNVIPKYGKQLIWIQVFE
tara:strand:- start:5260 stop:5511 length:252 start_codon:yes stop_codon:yes gene_type:complete